MTEPIRSIPPDHKEYPNLIVAQASTPWTVVESVMRPIWNAGIDGRGCIGISLDTGYKAHRSLPPLLAGRNFTGGSSSDVTDHHGHGVHTSGSMVGRHGLSSAPGASLKTGKVLGNDGSGSNTVSGLRWAADQEGDVVNLSWGGGQLDQSTESALIEIEQSGKWCCASAGNSGYNGRNSVIAPATSTHNVGVASMNEDGTVSGFSSGGPAVDVAAGGGMIISCGLNNNLILMSGTSMSSPTLASVLLLLRQAFKRFGMVYYLTARGLVAFLKSDGFLKDAGPVGKDPRTGEGVITPGNILNWIAAHALENA